MYEINISSIKTALKDWWGVCSEYNTPHEPRKRNYDERSPSIIDSFIHRFIRPNWRICQTKILKSRGEPSMPLLLAFRCYASWRKIEYDSKRNKKAFFVRFSLLLPANLLANSFEQMLTNGMPHVRKILRHLCMTAYHA
jgi:hypothetical protein